MLKFLSLLLGLLSTATCGGFVIYSATEYLSRRKVWSAVEFGIQIALFLWCASALCTISVTTLLGIG